MMEPFWLTRREFSLGALAYFSLERSFCYAQESTGTQILCAAADLQVPGAEAFLKTSGNLQLDRILAAELIEQSRFYGLTPAFMLYSGPQRNALATSETLLRDTHGTILYNLAFLEDQLRSTQWGGAIVAGVIAHEFGHIYQFFSAYAKRLRGLHRTVKFQELHADFLSGFYMAKKYIVSNVELQDYYNAFYELGDNQVNSIDHHGTKEERYFAIKAGHNLSLGSRNESVVFAAAQGELFLREYIR